MSVVCLRSSWSALSLLAQATGQSYNSAGPLPTILWSPMGTPTGNSPVFHKAASWVRLSHFCPLCAPLPQPSQPWTPSPPPMHTSAVHPAPWHPHSRQALHRVRVCWVSLQSPKRGGLTPSCRWHLGTDG